MKATEVFWGGAVLGARARGVTRTRRASPLTTAPPPSLLGSVTTRPFFWGVVRHRTSPLPTGSSTLKERRAVRLVVGRRRNSEKRLAAGAIVLLRVALTKNIVARSPGGEQRAAHTGPTMTDRLRGAAHHDLWSRRRPTPHKLPLRANPREMNRFGKPIASQGTRAEVQFSDHNLCKIPHFSRGSKTNGL